MSEPATSTVTVIDDRGDLTLIVRGEPDTDRKFLVSRGAMRLASPVWNAMLDTHGPFAEGSSNEVSLPDDDPDSLRILLNIAHLQFHKVPLLLSFPEFLALAELTDKYDVFRLVAPFISHWLPPLCNSAHAPKQVITVGKSEERLFVAWTFGITDTFKAAMRSITQRVKPGLLIADGDSGQDRQISERYIPEGLTKEILIARMIAIDLMMRAVHGAMDNIKAGTACQAPDHKEACRASMYGSIALEVVALGVWPDRPHPVRWPKSVLEVANKLLQIQVWIPPAHTECLQTVDLKTKVRRILANASGTRESHLRHMKDRALMRK